MCMITTKVRHFNKHLLEFRGSCTSWCSSSYSAVKALFAWFFLLSPTISNITEEQQFRSTVPAPVFALVRKVLHGTLLNENLFWIIMVFLSWFVMIINAISISFFLLLIHKYLLNKTISIKRNKSQSRFHNIPYHFFAELLFHVKLSFNFSAVVLIKMREVILWS